jgi:SAM-dependent methyltransferase
MESQPEPLPTEYFARYDEGADSNFYGQPRLVVHIDDGAIEAAGALYAELLPPDGALLDLMSSWRSHLPPDFRYRSMVGLGMNPVEMAQNPQLSSYVIRDLNADPALPFDDASFDGALCTVSVQYLTRPLAVFAEVGRTLTPGAPFVVTFSNRCFPSKAVRVWTSTDDPQHMRLVSLYFQRSGLFDRIEVYDRSPRGWGADPLYGVAGWKSQKD